MIPRYYQQESHDAAWDFMRTQDGSPLIVLPTGSGKSLVIAMLVQQAREYDARVIVLQHRKELIQQNAEKIQILLPDVKIGIHSAGLRRHAFDNDVICAGIQSVYKKAHEFGRRELIVVDEAHLIGGQESMYGRFLFDIRELNPSARMVGLTATPFRTGEGPICGKAKLFQRICYEAQTGDLIGQDFLCPVTNKPALAMVDTSKIKQRGGEFINSEAERAFNTDDNVGNACREIVDKCRDRHSILIFASGKEHAAQIEKCLHDLTGERVAVITGDTFQMEREQTLADFKQMQIRWLVNIDVLTTGFDAPCIDALAVLRATMSPGLFAQIVGRGLRKHESKQNCLVLDFGENLKRHGSLDDPEYGRSETQSRGTGDGQSEVVENNGRGKPCLNCGIDVAANARSCPDCGFLFPVKHESRADDESVITGEATPEEWLVEQVYWGKHVKKSDAMAPPTLRVTYKVQVPENGGNLSREEISEWVCIEHEGFAKTKAIAWWDARSEAEIPTSVDDAIRELDRGVSRLPSRITTRKEGHWKRVLSVEFEGDKPDVTQLAEPVNDFFFDGVF